MEVFKRLVYEHLGKYSQEMLDEFIGYWTEKNINGKKMRFEKEKTFGLSRRLSTWQRNSLKWDQKKVGRQTLDNLINNSKGW